MTVEQNKVVIMHYTLKNDQGETLDSSEGKDPLGLIHGTGMIIPGLENALTGKKKGASFNVSIEPKDGYGLRQDSLIKTVPITQFDNRDAVEEGARFHLDNGTMAVITEVNGDIITLDLNHPLADQHLHFDIEIVDVRDPSPEELNQGQPNNADEKQGCCDSSSEENTCCG